jgi:hypothetical protein
MSSMSKTYEQILTEYYVEVRAIAARIKELDVQMSADLAEHGTRWIDVANINIPVQVVIDLLALVFSGNLTEDLKGVGALKVLVPLLVRMVVHDSTLSPEIRHQVNEEAQLEGKRIRLEGLLSSKDPEIETPSLDRATEALHKMENTPIPPKPTLN